jgi:hypothetical protein
MTISLRSGKSGPVTSLSPFEGRCGTRSVGSIPSERPYSVAGRELKSNLRSSSSTEPRAILRGWASQHQPGRLLPVRYDPRNHDTVVAVEGDMPESGPQAPDDLKMILLFLPPSRALVTASRALQPKHYNGVNEKTDRGLRRVRAEAGLTRHVGATGTAAIEDSTSTPALH